MLQVGRGRCRMRDITSDDSKETTLPTPLASQPAAVSARNTSMSHNSGTIEDQIRQVDRVVKVSNPSILVFLSHKQVLSPL
ncbi:hypothetical protein Y032_0006g3037 [Ancylostoma ceylanicum]|uniref:Uncharacterized protein n=1 Tax=Ancylostoma ceylanicum TaxID=53326 RepID=A0A016VQJ7_9BILA|nr:hypothetical protein Y032_0006g3037 [Ancylostoma ceylanicum]